MNSKVKTANRPIVAYAAALWIACGVLAPSAHASDERSETVKFADLNLTSSEGVQALYGRIHAAAHRVCSQPAGEQAAVNRCVRKSEADAVAKVDVPLLTAFYQTKNGNSPKTIIAGR